MLSDEELIIEIRSGSQAAMEMLVKRHYAMIYSYVYRKIGNHHTAYDLTHRMPSSSILPEGKSLMRRRLFQRYVMVG